MSNVSDVRPGSTLIKIGTILPDIDPERTYTLAEALAHSSMIDIINREKPGYGTFG